MRPTRSCIFTNWYFSLTVLARHLLGRREAVLDDLEDEGEGGEGEDAHHHAANAGGDHEVVGRVAQVLEEIPIELGLAELLEADRGVELGLALARHQGTQEIDDRRRHLGIHHEIGAREAEDVRDLVLAGQQAVDIEPARLVVEDGDDEGDLVRAIDRLADDVGALVAVEGRAEHGELEVLLNRPIGREARADGAHQTADVAPHVPEGALEASILEDAGDDAGKAVARRVIGPEDRNLGLQMLGGDQRPDEDVAVVVVVTVEEAAEDRVVEGLRQLRLVELGQQTQVFDLDPPPEAVARIAQMELAPQQGDRLTDALVVEADAIARGGLNGGPVGLLETPLGIQGDLAEETVVALEAFEDGFGDEFGFGPGHWDQLSVVSGQWAVRSCRRGAVPRVNHVSCLRSRCWIFVMRRSRSRNLGAVGLARLTMNRFLQREIG